MLQTFIQQTVNLLKYSDVRLHLVEYRNVEFHEEGTTGYLFGESRYGVSKLEDNLIIQIMLFFTVLDAKVDTTYPHLEGHSFVSKYNSLPTTTDEEIIFSQAYRLMRILRNNAIHSMSSIEYKNNIIFSRGRSSLEITKQGYELLYSMIYYLINPSESNKNRHVALLRTYYGDLQKEINHLDDKISQNQLIPLSTGICLKRHLRYRVLNSEYEVMDNKLIITNIYTLKEDYYKWCGIDYVIKYDDKTYLIPIEDMTERSEIKIFHLSKWLETK